jgi:cell division protein FtsX
VSVTDVRWVLRRIARRLRGELPGFLLLALAFAAIAGLGAGAHTLSRQSAAAAARLAEEAHVIAYLDEGLPAERVRSLREAFGRLPSVRSVREVDGARALAELQRHLRTLGESPGGMVAGLEAGFLPTSLEIVLAPGAALEKRAADVALRLKRLPGVDAVDAMTEGLDKVAAFQALARRLAGLLGAVAIIAALALGAAIVFRQRGQRREEARSLLLVGTHPLAIWLPASAVAALAALSGGLAGVELGRVLAATLFDPALALPALPSRGWLWAAGLLLAAGLLVGRLSIPAVKRVHAR